MTDAAAKRPADVCLRSQKKDFPPGAFVQEVVRSTTTTLPADADTSGETAPVEASAAGASVGAEDEAECSAVWPTAEAGAFTGA